MRHLYIHIPYCRSKCIYCDFFSIGAIRADWAGLRRSLLREFVGSLSDGFLSEEEAGAPCETLYLGGGTPSLMPAEELSRLIEGLAENGLTFSPQCERTIELNPDDVSPESIGVWRELGFNRFSMGVQSFRDEDLRTIRRRHTAARARRACELLKPAGNLSIDLIFGLPGQTLEQWKSNVAEAIGLRPQHISAYSLMREEGTALDLMMRQGRLEAVSDATAESMAMYLIEALRDGGYVHYEISNFSLPGFESRHNSAYWDGSPYLGLGPGAHSYDGRSLRRCNRGNMAAYLAGESAEFREEECLNEEQLRDEYIMCRMRTAAGIDLHQFRARFGNDSLRRLLRAAESQRQLGLIKIEENRMALTEESILRSDPVMVALML